MNDVTLIGRLTKDCEYKSVGSSSVYSTSMAISKKYKDRNGDTVEKNIFIDLKIWGKLGEAFSKYVLRGHLVAVKGEIDQETWETNEGAKRSKILVVVNKFEFLPNKKNESSSQEYRQSNPTSSEPDFGSFGDEDIPF